MREANCGNCLYNDNRNPDLCRICNDATVNGSWKPNYDVLQKRVERVEAELKKIQEFHPRAMKLIRKRKNFIVIAEDEPYFIEVYSIIRINELNKLRWTEDDERIFQSTLEHRRKKFPSTM